MKIVNQKAEFRWMTPDPLKAIETAARICYKSEDRSTPENIGRFVSLLVERGHTSMIEHASMSYKVICDRGVSHAVVRHRLFSFAQESTQYCNYGKLGEITVVQPVGMSPEGYVLWREAAEKAEVSYLALVRSKHRPETARSVLPTCVKTELIITGNFTEWRHFFKLRTGKGDQDQIKMLAREILEDSKRRVGIVFDDLHIESGSL